MKTNKAVRSFLLQQKTATRKKKISAFLEENKPVNREQRRQLEKESKRVSK